MKKGIFTLMLVGLMASSAMAQLKCVNWVNMADEPDYAAVPYAKLTYNALPAPAGWAIGDTSKFDFDAAWTAAGVEAFNSNPINIEGGDIFDLGKGDTYGSSYKALYDKDNLYILIKWIGANKADAGSLEMEFMFQPTSIDRYEPDFTAAAGDKALQNASYARYVELGGGKGVFKDGLVTAVQASLGKDASWFNNDHALTSLALVTHVWKKNGSVIKAVLVMPISALSYPTNISDLTARTPLEIVADETKISWDLKDNIKVATKKVQYAWCGNKNNVYAVNYYAGYLLFAKTPAGSAVSEIENNGIKVYNVNNNLTIKGIDNANVAIYNINGQLVKTILNVSDAVSISDLANGMYLVRLNNETQSYKIVKF